MGMEIPISKRCRDRGVECKNQADVGGSAIPTPCMDRVQFVEKTRDVVGLYLDPPDRALVLCVDETSEIVGQPDSNCLVRKANSTSLRSITPATD